jgi:Spy/CpxP family protein refolding chaperone
MKCFSGRILAAVAAVAIVAMASQAAMAQNEGGRRGRGGRGGQGGPGMGGPIMMGQLLRDENVQSALKLSDDQKSKLKQIGDEMREEREKMRSDAQGGGRPDFEKMRKVMETNEEKVKEVLNADQQKRLLGIFVQVAGPFAAMNPSVQKELSITDEQKDKLREAMGPPPGGREGRGERGADGFRERREKMEKEVMAVLTPDQRKKLEDLKGEKVDVDMSKLRGPGRGGRDRGNRGERGASKEN